MAAPEAKVLGAQSLVDGLYADLCLRFRVKEKAELDQQMADLLDSLTGGDFTVAGRSPDPDRASRSMQNGSVVVVALRRVHRNTMPLARMAQIANENRHRRIDMPRGWPDP